MMTSMVSNQSRGTRDKTLPTTTQTTQPQKQIQATAEQIRLAQVIYDKNDADFEEKVKQLIEVTGKTQDECMVALHDCNEDVNRAINFLLESTSDTNSWETVGKKRSLGKEGGPSEIKDSKEKRGLEREGSRGRGASNRRGRGISRGREGRVEENGFEVAPGERRGDPGRRGRGRGIGVGVGVRGRGRGAAGTRFSTQGMGTFNPADYTANSGTRQEQWEGDGNEPAEGTGTWGGNVEDWTSEDWNEDLSETKVFTASTTPGHNVDVAGLLPKGGVNSMESDLGAIVDGPSAEDLGQSLVFTNSHHNGRTATHSYAHATANSYAHAASAGTTYAHAALSSVLGSGFGSLNAPKPTPGPDMRTSEQLNGPRLGQRVSQTIASTSNSNVSKDAGPPPTQNPAPASSPSVEIKPQRVENGPVTTQHLEIKLQPEPSAVLSQLAQRQHQSTIHPSIESLGLSQSHAPQIPTPPGHESSMPPVRDGASPGVKLPGMDPITEAPQRQLKTQRRRVPPPSKIPSSAVEMPGSADIPGLNVQFGALDFGSEAGTGTADTAQTESAREQAPAQAAVPAAPAPMSIPSSVPTQQPQSSLFSKPGAVSDHMSSLPTLPSAASDPCFPTPSLGLPSATPSPSLGLPSAAAPPSSAAPAAANRVENSGPRTLPPHLGYSQSKDVPAAVALTNGYSGMKTQSPQDPSPRAVKTESPVMTSDGGSSHHIPSPAVTPSHSTAMSSLNSHVTSTLSSGSTLASSSLVAVSSLTTNGLHQSGAPGLTPNGTNSTLSAAGTRVAPLLATSGKAPPNLAQGVPPLLANQYIMGPGGLLPAYPQIYGYEDLQMLQSRLPMDYYGVTFPGTTATLPGRDGLANNPYSGEATKFGRNDSSSPAPPTSLSNAGVQAQAQQAPQAGNQGQGQGQSQGQQTQNQAFLNPPLPPGYGYTGLPYYTGVPGVPSAFQYGPTVFVPPASAKQPTMGLANPSNQYHQQHQPSYGQHAYGAAFDDLSQAHGGEYSKGGYGGSAQSQAKSAGSGPGKAPGLSGSGTGGGVPDMGGSIYSKTQSFDKQGFHTGTPPPFSLPSALGGTGPLNPGGAPGYAPAPFLHILPPHQQPHSQLLHHHLTQDGQGGPGQRSQSSSMQQKTQGSKSSYGSSPYWAN
ncbi:ubiquitin-associated protein 2-like isoform X2 [Notolabrus celidotus]|uniref:ubiquitin-associated protein 2-like isoform X2 n=1 Tax=Notolabrus celidotus TaxID=1203425 RepID=UPI00149089F5|nr:ubiquitin-associated protein 2-like isoform X2 [Notolabrus celidotus]